MNIAFRTKNLFVHRVVVSLLIVSILFSLSFGNLAFGSDDPVSTTEESNSTYYNYNNIYAASSIAYMGAEWSDARHAWGFNYRYSGTGASRSSTSGDASDLVRIAAMEIEGTSNTANMAIWTSSDSKYIGSAPESSGTDAYYDDVADSVVGLAITAINNLGASYVWSTLGLLKALLSTVDDQTTQNDYIWRKWDWSPDQSDVGQFFWFIVDVEPYETVQISNEYMIFGPGYELLSAGKGYRNLEAGAPPSSTSTTSTSTTSTNSWNPGMMSDEERRKYGIEEIPREQFKKRAAELHISPRSIEEFENSDAEVFYYAHNFVEYEVNPSEKEPNTPKGVLIKEINTQLERSEKIIKAFSTNKDMNEEDLRIIEKHKELQPLLEELLDRSQSINEDDRKAIDALRKELWNDILKETSASRYR
jgi:hypothetical protein